MKIKTKRIVLAALMAALTCIATIIIKIPSPLKGYLNIGDCVVLVTGWILSPVFAFLAAGLGSALADILSGYLIYAPITFLIKGCMAIVASYSFRLLRKRSNVLASRIIGGFVAEIIMIFGYYLFEGILYGYVSSAVNIPANGVQGAAGLILGIALIKIVDKSKINLW